MTEQSKSIWRADVTLESLKQRTLDTLVSHMGIEIIELGSDYIKASMPVDSRTCQPLRILHGGASVVLAETLGSFAANAVVDNTKFACVGQS